MLHRVPATTQRPAPRYHGLNEQLPGNDQVGLTLRRLLAFGAAAMMLPAIAASAAATDQLQIYFIDVEGGQSTLIVTPAREVLLIDAGFAGEGGFSSVPGDPAKARDPAASSPRCAMPA